MTTTTTTTQKQVLQCLMDMGLCPGGWGYETPEFLNKTPKETWVLVENNWYDMMEYHKEGPEILCNFIQEAKGPDQEFKNILTSFVRNKQYRGIQNLLSFVISKVEY